MFVEATRRNLILQHPFEKWYLYQVLGTCTRSLEEHRTPYSILSSGEWGVGSYGNRLPPGPRMHSKTKRTPPTVSLTDNRPQGRFLRRDGALLLSPTSEIAFPGLLLRTGRSTPHLDRSLTTVVPTTAHANEVFGFHHRTTKEHTNTRETLASPVRCEVLLSSRNPLFQISLPLCY